MKEPVHTATSERDKITARLRVEIIQQLIADIEKPNASKQKGLVYLADLGDVGAFYFERLSILDNMKKEAIVLSFKVVTKEDEMGRWSDLEIEQYPEEWFEYKESFFPQQRNFAEVVFNPKKALKLSDKQTMPNNPKIHIRDAILIEKEGLLLINNGEIVLSFSTRRQDLTANRGSESENLSTEERKELEFEIHKTKQFKVLSELWRHRYSRLNGKTIPTKNAFGETTSLAVLTSYSGSQSPQATIKHIRRLNAYFRDRGIPIKIDFRNKIAIQLFVEMS